MRCLWTTSPVESAADSDDDGDSGGDGDGVGDEVACQEGVRKRESLRWC